MCLACWLKHTLKLSCNEVQNTSIVFKIHDWKLKRHYEFTRLDMTFPFSLSRGYHSHPGASLQHGLSAVSMRLVHGYLDTGNGSFNPPCWFSSSTMCWFAFLLFFQFGHRCVGTVSAGSSCIISSKLRLRHVKEKRAIRRWIWRTMWKK